MMRGKRRFLSTLIVIAAMFPHAEARAKCVWLDPGRVELSAPIEVGAGESLVLAGRGPGRTVLLQ